MIISVSPPAYTRAQDQSAQDKDRPSAAAPPSADERSPDQQKSILSAVVIQVSGQAHWALAGTSPLTQQGWTPMKVGDEIESGSLIRTGLRSYVNLQFGRTTTVSVRSASYAGVDQFYRSATTETVRIGLGYGTVRGGSSEGEIRADVEVRAPVATLAKRGTEGWEITVESGTGRFRISLAERGLVEVIKLSRQQRVATRMVRPGQYATDTNIANMWINQDIFDRNVRFYEANFVTEADADFLTHNTRGYGTLAPGGGTTLVDLSQRVSRDFVLATRPGSGPTPLPTIPIGVSGPVARPEGNFGTGGIFKRR